MAQDFTAESAVNISLLRNVQGFSSLNESVLKKMAEIAEYQTVSRGEVLIHEGQPANNLYIVLKGRFVVLVGETPIAEISMGEPIGELAFFAGGTRTASVVAARNSNVMRLSRDAYDAMAEGTPELSNGILAALSERLIRAISSSPELRPKAGKVCSVFPGGEATIDPRFVANLRDAFASVNGWRVIDEADCPASAATDPESLTAWLEEQETEYGNLVLLCTDPTTHATWRKVAADNSDTVLIVLEKSSDTSVATEPSQIEQGLFEATLRTNIQLALYRPEKAHPTTDTARWLDGRDVALHHHIALDSDDDFDRLGRFIRGEALGLVLCGGGSFGTAHLGAIKALLERGYRFDFVGGTSVGSAMGGALAIGLAPGKVMDLCEDIFIKRKAMSRLTVPKYSVLDHHRLDEALTHHFGAFNIEDAPINFFAVATSLTKNDVSVLRRGPMWHAIRSSTSLPGVFPPFIMEDGEVLIDGGLLDNVPVTIMRDLKPGPNLILNFLAPKPWRVKTKYEDLPTRGQAITSLVTRPKKGKARPPSVMSILSRAMVVNARKLLQQTEIGNDLLLNISTLRGMSFMDWARGRELFDAAYHQMGDAIDLAEDGVITEEGATKLDRLRDAAEIINASGTDG
jgi:NTE family protein